MGDSPLWGPKHVQGTLQAIELKLGDKETAWEDLAKHFTIYSLKWQFVLPQVRPREINFYGSVVFLTLHNTNQAGDQLDKNLIQKVRGESVILYLCSQKRSFQLKFIKSSLGIGTCSTIFWPVFFWHVYRIGVTIIFIIQYSYHCSAKKVWLLSLSEYNGWPLCPYLHISSYSYSISICFSMGHLKGVLIYLLPRLLLVNFILSCFPIGWSWNIFNIP